MNESEWLTLTDSVAMLDHMLYVRYGTTTHCKHPGSFARKLRLFSVACAEAFDAICLKASYGEEGELINDPVRRAFSWAHSECPIPRPLRAAILRCICGNPFRPQETPWTVEKLIGPGAAGNPLTYRAWHPRVRGIMTWNDDTVPKIARAIYDGQELCQRRCYPTTANYIAGPRSFRNNEGFEYMCDCDDGYCETDFHADLMPILADALEEAGCDNDDILNHCREPGPHVRGCWVIDTLLGKE